MMLAMVACAAAELVQNHDFSGATEYPWSHSGYAPWGGSWIDLAGDYFRGAGWGDGISSTNNAVWQDTSATFQPNTTYVMTAEWRDGEPDSGKLGDVQLVIYDVTTGLDVTTFNTGAPLEVTTWETDMIILDTSAYPGIVGDNIGVAVRNMDLVGGAWMDVNYISLIIAGGATTPDPQDAVTVDPVATTQLSWEYPLNPPVGSYTSQVYLGTPNIGSAVLLPDGDNTDNVVAVSSLLPGSSYEWRVDVVDSGAGTITGDVWSFQTVSAPVDNDVAIDPDVRFQTFEGFGVGTMDQFIPDWYDNWTTAKLNEYLDQMYTLDNDGLGLEITRVPMPVGDDPSHAHMWAYINGGGHPPAAFETADGVFNWTGHEDILWHIQGAEARGVKMWAYWHGVPHWMSVSGCSAGHTDGTQNNLPAGQEARFAEHICDVLEHFKDYWSVDFDFVGAINEPDEDWWVYGGNQPGCHVDASQAVTIYQELQNEMTSRGLTTKMIAPDSFSASDVDDRTYLDTLRASAVGPDIDVYGCHQYAVNDYGVAQWYWRALKDNKSFWQTEWGDWVNSGWGGPDDPLAQAENYANKIQYGLKDMKVTGYTFWESDFFLNSATTTFTLRKSYWIAAQFTRFIRSGMRMLHCYDNNSNCKTSVWIDPNDNPAGQKLILVTVNDGSGSVSVNYDLSGFHGVNINEVRRTSPTEDYVSLPITQPSPFDFSVYAPSKSVVTVSATIQRCEDMATDQNNDCITDIQDVKIVGLNWLNSQVYPCSPLLGDTNNDCSVDLKDQAEINGNWLDIKAFNPDPSDGQTGVNPQGTISWGDNYYAVSYDLYLGTDPNSVEIADNGFSEFQGNQTDAFFTPILGPNQTYYFRVDAEDGSGQFHTGDLWSFTTGSITTEPALAGWWKLDETSGDAQDSSSANNIGTLYGDVQWRPALGKIDGAAELDGTQDWVAVPDFNLTTNNVTFTAWINGWKANDWAGIVYSRSAMATGMHFGGDNKLHYTWNYDDSSTWNWSGGPAIPQNDWALVAMVIEPDKATLYVYSVAGGLQSAVNNIPHVPQTIDDLKFGYDDVVGGWRYFDGLVDDVRIYDRALTSQEILDLVP